MVLGRNSAVGLSSRQEIGYLQSHYLNIHVTFKKMGGKFLSHKIGRGTAKYRLLCST